MPPIVRSSPRLDPGFLAGVLVFIVAIADLPGIQGAGLAPRWAVISIGIPMLVIGLPIRRSPAHWLGLGLFGYAALSLIWTTVFYDGINELWQFSLYAGAFCVGAQLRSLCGVYYGLGLGLIGSAIVVTFNLAGMTTPFPEVTPDSGGLFVNKNLMAEASAMALIGLAPSPLALVPLALLGTAKCASAVLGVGAAGFLWLWIRVRWAAALFALATAIALGGLAWGVGKVGTLEHRQDIWLDAIGDLRWFGHGVGSYWVAQAENSPRQELNTERNTRELHAHNDPLEIAFNYGLPGFILFASMVFYALGAPAERERLVLIAFLVEGLFGFPLFMPTTGLVAAMVLGRLSGMRHRLRLAVAGGGSRSGTRGDDAEHHRPRYLGRGSEAVPVGAFVAPPAG